MSIRKRTVYAVKMTPAALFFKARAIVALRPYPRHDWKAEAGDVRTLRSLFHFPYFFFVAGEMYITGARTHSSMNVIASIL
jgi:hypothetical protein